MCVKGFFDLLMQTKRQKVIHVLKFDKQVTVSHLLFANENFNFTKASIEIVKT